MTHSASLNSHKRNNSHNQHNQPFHSLQRVGVQRPCAKWRLLAAVWVAILWPTSASAAEHQKQCRVSTHQDALRIDIASTANANLANIAPPDCPPSWTADKLSITDSDEPYVLDSTTTVCNGIRIQDEIALISTRPVGCSCDPEVLRSGLHCQRYAIRDSRGCRSWQREDLTNILSASDPMVPTVIFVHGNRVAPGEDKRDGLLSYRRIVRRCRDDRPMRLIIFSWSSTEIPGLLKDARVKAARTRPVGYQLAWTVDQIPSETPLSYIGYSFGSRVITGALHLLGGGHLHGLELRERVNPERAPARAMLIASALDANWLGPGQYHGMAMSQIDQVLLVNNRCDPIMRWYHLSTCRGHPQALGLAGPTCIGEERWKIRNRDFSRYVGAHHDLRRYLSSPVTACQFQQYASW